MPRLFAAIRVPPNDALRALLDQFQPIRGVKPVAPENLHYTLRFFGDLPDTEGHALLDAFQQATTDQPAFDVTITGTSAFPTPKRPRVVWVGSDPATEAPLLHIADTVDAIAAPLGLGPRDKPFVPHVTVARVKHLEGRGQADVQRILRSTENDTYGTIHVDRFQLIESRLLPNGPAYVDVAEVRLA